ncbi:hypothetical protein HOY80DRAFT_1009413 [Tuber brumale]|nr:hypothetical protein HOY80DRAFT_1009413 [Tuber brumale]
MLVMIGMEIVNVYRRGPIRGALEELPSLDTNSAFGLSRWPPAVGTSLWDHREIYHCTLSEFDVSIRYELPRWIGCHPPLGYSDLQHKWDHNTTSKRCPSPTDPLRQCPERTLACPALHNNNSHLHTLSRPPAGSKLPGPAKWTPDGVLAGREGG